MQARWPCPCLFLVLELEAWLDQPISAAASAALTGRPIFSALAPSHQPQQHHPQAQRRLQLQRFSMVLLDQPVDLLLHFSAAAAAWLVLGA